MKRTIFTLLAVCMLLLAACGKTDEPKEVQTTTAPSTFAIGRKVEVSFDFTRMPTQASNQIAVWVEDEAGNIVKTVYVSGFTGEKRGYERRENALPQWVEAASPSAMPDAALDAVSGATPQDGSCTYVWDMTDGDGNAVPDGAYTVKLEGTLYWSSDAVYSAVVDTKTPGEVNVSESRSELDNVQNEEMIRNVKIVVR